MESITLWNVTNDNLISKLVESGKVEKISLGMYAKNKIVNRC